MFIALKVVLFQNVVFIRKFFYINYEFIVTRLLKTLLSL